MNVLLWPVDDHRLRLLPERKAEYLTDALYHGLKISPGIILHTPFPLWHMHKGSEGTKQSMHGRGFSLYAKLPPDNIGLDRNFREAVVSGEMDAVALTIHSTMAWPGDKPEALKAIGEVLDFVGCYYRKEKIALVDGVDQQKVNYYEVEDRVGHYFKRELADDEPGWVKSVQYGVPEGLIVKEVPDKEKEFSSIVPGQPYTFTQEEDYHREYQRSRYGTVTRRGGWNTMRVLEVLANGCCPWFEGLQDCPERTLKFLPKEIILAGMGLKQRKGPDREYVGVVEELLGHTRAHLTTRATARRLLEDMLS